MTTLLELFVCGPALSGDQRRRAADALVTELIRADGAPTEVIERGRAMTTVVVHDVTVGARPTDPAEPPRYLVRLTVPAGHLDDAMRAEAIARLTRALAHLDPDPARLYDEPAAWVHVIEVPEGNVATMGAVVGPIDIVNLTLDPGYRPTAALRPPGDPVAPTTVDPICGMTVPLTDDAITVEHDGSTYAFCNPGCRDVFVAQPTPTPGGGTAQ